MPPLKTSASDMVKNARDTSLLHFLGLAGRALRVALPFPNGQFCRRHLRTVHRYLNLMGHTFMPSLAINMHQARYHG